MMIETLKKYYNNYYRYKNYKGYAKRLEYWKMLAVIIPLYLIERVVLWSLAESIPTNKVPDLTSILFSTRFIFVIILLILYLLPFFYTAFRRCNDIGISRWCTLLVLIDYISIVFIIMLGCLNTGAWKKFKEAKKSYFNKKKK